MMPYSQVVVIVQEKALYIKTDSFLSLRYSSRSGSQQNISILTNGTENKREIIVSQPHKNLIMNSETTKLANKKLHFII